MSAKDVAKRVELTEEARRRITKTKLHSSIETALKKMRVRTEARNTVVYAGRHPNKVWCYWYPYTDGAGEVELTVPSRNGSNDIVRVTTKNRNATIDMLMKFAKIFTPLLLMIMVACADPSTTGSTTTSIKSAVVIGNSTCRLYPVNGVACIVCSNAYDYRVAISCNWNCSSCQSALQASTPDSNTSDTASSDSSPMARE